MDISSIIIELCSVKVFLDRGRGNLFLQKMVSPQINYMPNCTKPPKSRNIDT